MRILSGMAGTTRHREKPADRARFEVAQHDLEHRMGSIQHKPVGSNHGSMTVYVIDGDKSVLEGVQSLVSTLGVCVAGFRSAEQFLESVDFDKPGCVITEVHLPGISGLDLQEVLRKRGVTFPVIVMASEADVPMAVRAMAQGALDFIEKPFVDRILVARVKQALHST